MKKITLFIFFLIFNFIFSHSFGYELAIYTDQEDKSKAQEVIQTFKQTYPFNTLEISYKIIPTTTEQLNCNQHASISRLLKCDSSHVRSDSAAKGFDQALIVRDVAAYGGSGGSIPVISTGSDSRMILHEYLHTLGLCDEYAYSNAEATIYCKEGLLKPNLTVINPKDEGYSSDQEARNEHGRQIPWFSDISSTTLITNNRKLGTAYSGTITAPINSSTSPTAISTPTGLYKAETCNDKSPPVHAWHPGGEKTIMDQLDFGLGAANEKIVREILISKGARPIPTSSQANANANVADGDRSTENLDSTTETVNSRPSTSTRQ